MNEPLPCRREQHLRSRPAGALLALPLSLFLLGAASARAPGEPASLLEQVRSEGLLIAGVARDTPPFSRQVRDGRLEGFDVDLVEGLARHLGVRPMLVPLAGGARLPAVRSGQVQLTAATLSRTPERERIVDFSSVYLVDSQRLLVRADGGIRSLADLEGARVGVARGSTAEAGLSRRAPTARAVPFGSSREALPALMTGRIDAIAADSSILEGLRRLPHDGPALMVVGEPLSEEAYALALPKGDALWRAELNAYLDEIRANGQWQRMTAPWFGDTAARPYPEGFRPSEAASR